MEVERKASQFKLFGEVENGQVFEKHNTYYLKLEEAEDRTNAASLDGSEQIHVDNDEKVMIIIGQFVEG